MNQRRKRIILGTVLPAPLGTFVVLTGSLMDDIFPDGIDFVRDEGIFLLAGLATLMFAGSSLVAFLLVGIQSFLCAIVMERMINPRVTNNRLALGLAGFLGLLAAIPTSLVLPADGFELVGSTLLLLTGTLVGVLVGAILRRNYHRFPPL